LPRRRRAHARDERAPVTVVVRVPNWLGDCVMSLPALRAIKQAHGDEEVMVIAHDSVVPLYRCVSEIDDVLGFAFKTDEGKAAARAALRQHQDSRGYLFVNSFSGAWQFWRAGVHERIGFNRGINRLLLTRAVDDRSFAGRHQVHRYLGLVEAATGFRGDPGAFLLTPPAEAMRKADKLLGGTPAAGRGYFVVHPGAQYGPAKRWPATKFRDAAAAVAAATGLVPAIVAGPRDEGAAACPDGGVDLSGKTPLPVLLALFARAAFALVNDSGPMHLAAASGTKVIALFLSTDPGATAPLGEGHQLLTADVSCRPCLKRTCPRKHYQCAEALTKETVVAAAQRLLASGVTVQQ